MARRKFHLDRRNGMLLGVCAGLGRTFNIDPTFVRVGVVLVTLLGAFPWTLVAYGLAAWMGKPLPVGRYGEEDLELEPRRHASTKDLRLNMRDIDRRMAEVERYVTSSNDSLAQEIEKLR